DLRTRSCTLRIADIAIYDYHGTVRRANGGAPMITNSSINKSAGNSLKIVVIGGSGLIGKKLVQHLREQGHDVVAASPSTGVNTITREGLAEALTNARVVVDVANAPVWEDK